MSNQKPWYHIDNAGEIDSPALLVFPERVKANIRTAINMIGDINRLRPHIKTHKCAEVAKLMMDAGIYKFKCATIAEAEMLGMGKAKDVVLAYQPQGPKLKRFIELIKKYPETVFSCLTDNLKTAGEQSKAFADAGLNVNIYIDLNVGMNRTGIAPDDTAIELYVFCSTAPGMNIKGLHAYDGHIRNVDFDEKKKACDEAFAKVKLLSDKIVHNGLEKPVIIMGGSPAFSVHCKREDMECSPGTFIYWDHGYATICPEQDFLPAAVLITRVLSFPTDGKICTDLGHKSVAAENDISKRVYFPGYENLHAVSQSEEHLVLENKSSYVLQQGDVLFGIPVHICPTVALYDSVLLVENGQCNGFWKNIARDRSITI
jgi:D-threonine aldolase